MEELNLGTGNIGSLVKRFSIPCVISMVVAALYNIVDQIFIGWSIWKCCDKHRVSFYGACIWISSACWRWSSGRI